MAGDSVGQIGLDLTVKRKDFNSQITGITDMAKKAGLMLAAAFSVKKIVDFGKQSIKMAAITSEAETKLATVMRNTMDATKSQIAAVYDLTAAQAQQGVISSDIQKQGLQELSTYLSKKESIESLLPVMNDMIAQQYGYNATGESAVNIATMLGKVMDGQTGALSRYGYKFTEAQEKVLKYGTEAERVATLTEVITESVGGMNEALANTPAGQLAQLKNNMGDLMGTIGQGLQNALMPAIRVVNNLVVRLMSLANAFSSFVAMLTGNKGGTASIASGMGDVADSVDAAADAVGGAGDAAKKAVKGTSTGIDELNIINPDSSSGSGSGGGASAADEYDMGEIDTSAIDELDNKYAALIDRLKELGSLFTEGFKIGFGDMSVLDSIKGHLDGIKTSLMDIFTDKNVLQSANQFLDSIALNFGKVAGSFASVGATIADNLLGGIDKYLKKDSPRIKDFLVSMFDIGAQTADIVGNFFVAVADIFTVFRSDTAKQITADIIKLFMDGFMGTKELAASFGRDILDLITAPIIQNTGGFKDALNGLLDAVQTVTSSVAETFEYFVDGVLKLYDESVKPLIQSFRDGFSEIVKTCLDAFNTHILPVIQYAAEQFQDFCTNTLQPLIDKFLEFAEKVCECIKALWENILLPFIIWFINTIAPYIAKGLKFATDVFFAFLEAVGKVLGHVIDALGGLIDFLTGVFTGDWGKAWEGIKTFLSGIWEAMKTIVHTIFLAIGGLISSVLDAIKTIWETIWGAIKQFISNLWDGIKQKAEEIFEAIRDKLGEIWDAIKETIEKKWNAIKEWFDNIWQNIKDIFKLDEMVEIGANIMSKLWEGLQGVWNSICEWLGGIADFIGNTFSNIVEGAKNLFKSAKDDAESDSDSEGDTSSGYVDSGPGAQGHATGGFPKSGSMFVANEDGNPELVGSWGGKAAVANNMQITEGIARAVQYGMRSAIAPLVSSVTAMTANATPPLQMVGSTGTGYNESTIQDLVSRVVAMSQQGGNEADLSKVISVLERITELVENLDLVVNIDIREMQKKLKDMEKRSGYSFA